MSDEVTAVRSRVKELTAILSSVVIVLVLIALVNMFELEDTLRVFLEQAKSAGWRGHLALIVVVALSVMFLVPSVILTLGAGLLYGTAVGSLTIVVAESIGATIAFLLGRWVLNKPVKTLSDKYARLHSWLSYTGEKNWRFVALTRMIPFFPFKLSNYVFGLTPLRVRYYVLGTFIGLWPITLLNVYLGSMAADVLSLRSTDIPKNIFYWAISLAGLLVVIVLLLFTSHRAIQSIKQMNKP